MLAFRRITACHKLKLSTGWMYLLQLALTTLLFSSCTVHEALAPLQPTAFITRPQCLRKPELTPFDLSWRKEGHDYSNYNSVLIAPVNTAYVDLDRWIFSAGPLMPTREEYVQQVQNIAGYIHRRVKRTFSRKSEQGAKVVEESRDELSADCRTLKLEISIAEVNFGNPLVYGGLLVVPLPGVANLSTTLKSPSITLEARYLDLRTQQVVAELIVRRFPKLKIIDVNRLTISSSVREMSDSFAENLVNSFYRSEGEKVQRPFPFSILPW